MAEFDAPGIEPGIAPGAAPGAGVAGAGGAGVRFAGVGIDLVDVDGFAEQLDLPGSRFSESFAAREIRLARRRSLETGQPEAHHLAARWAAKEAFIKAWSSALIGAPPVMGEVDMAEIVVDADSWNRPMIVLEGSVREAYENSVGVRAYVSMSHDAGYATAIVVLSNEAMIEA